MSAELMLINPRRRRRSHAHKNPRRRRKMTALQMKYFGKGHGRVTRRRRRKSRSVTVARSNPVAIRRRHRRHHRRRTIHVRRNPISTRGITSTLTGAAIGAGGAIGLNYLWQKLAAGGTLPASISSGMGGTFAQGAAAIGLGWAASKAFGGSVGAGIATGALTVILYNAASGMLSGSAGGGGLISSYGNYGGGGYYGGNYSGGYGVGSLGIRRARKKMGRYVPMSRYVGMKGLGKGFNIRPGRLRGLGYMGPARTVGSPVGHLRRF